MRPGTIVKTEHNQNARVLWIDAEEGTLGVFYVQSTSYDILKIDTVTAVQDESPFEELDGLSLEQIQERLTVKQKKKETKAPKKKTQRQVIAELLKAMPEERRAELIEQAQALEEKGKES